jgi:hypothetical protein
MSQSRDRAGMVAAGSSLVLNTDRDLLAQWVGEETTAAKGAVASRGMHAARQRFYLDILRRLPDSAASHPA